MGIPEGADDDTASQTITKNREDFPTPLSATPSAPPSASNQEVTVGSVTLISTDASQHVTDEGVEGVDENDDDMFSLDFGLPMITAMTALPSTSSASSLSVTATTTTTPTTTTTAVPTTLGLTSSPDKATERGTQITSAGTRPKEDEVKDSNSGDVSKARSGKGTVKVTQNARLEEKRREPRAAGAKEVKKTKDLREEGGGAGGSGGKVCAITSPIYDHYVYWFSEKDGMGGDSTIEEARTAALDLLCSKEAKSLVPMLHKSHQRGCPVEARLRRAREDEARIARERTLMKRSEERRRQWGLQPRDKAEGFDANETKGGNKDEKGGQLGGVREEIGGIGKEASKIGYGRATLHQPLKADSACECGVERPAHLLDRIESLQLFRYGRARRLDPLGFARNTVGHLQGMGVGGCQFESTADFLSVLVVVAESEELLHAEATLLYQQMTRASRKVGN